MHALRHQLTRARNKTSHQKRRGKKDFQHCVTTATVVDGINEGWVRPTSQEAALDGLPKPPGRGRGRREEAIFPSRPAWPEAEESGSSPQIGEGGKKGWVDPPAWMTVSFGQPGSAVSVSIVQEMTVRKA